MSSKPRLTIYYTNTLPIEDLTLDGILFTVKKISKEQIKEVLQKAKQYYEIEIKYYPERLIIFDKNTIAIFKETIYDDYYGFYEDIYYILYRVRIIEVNGFCCIVVPESEHLQALLAEAGII